MKLILVRHGETDWNVERRVVGHNAPGLNERGRLQARRLAYVLLEEKPVALYSSPLPRALETARPIAEVLGLQVVPVEGLIEADAGELEGLTYEELHHRYGEFVQRWNQDPTLPMPGGESLEAVQKRAWELVQTLLQRHPKDTVVGVTHYFPIVALVCKALGIPLIYRRHLEVDRGSLTTLEINGEKGQLLAFNDRCHQGTALDPRIS